MIEINLLPGGRKRSAKGGGRFSLPLPDLSFLKGIGLPAGDPWTIGAAACVAVAILGSGWLWFSTSGDAEEVDAQIEVALADSARYDGTIQRTTMLQARSDTIARRVGIIQQVDEGRYVWPHLIDEVGRAVPPNLWLTRITQVSGGSTIAFQIEGLAGNLFAYTSFFEALEASPYIQRVEPGPSEQTEVNIAGGVSQMLLQFTFDAQSEEPPEELMQRVPLFGADEAAEAGA